MVQLMKAPTVRVPSNRLVFHGSWLDDWSPTPHTIMHVGTQVAALDRLSNLANDGTSGCGVGRIWALELTVRPEPFLWADPDLPMDESEVRREEGRRYHQVNDTDVPARPRRYINEYEDPGSMSFVVSGEHLRVLGVVTTIAADDAYGRTSSFSLHDAC